MNKLTCILTFLNEGIEVFRTVKSIRDSVGDTVDILLVDDSSTDGVPYKVVANKFNCDYVKSDTRQGVAGARDLGVSLAKTPYCILFDAHMRFDKRSNWAERVVEEIENNDRRIYCTTCVSLWYPFIEQSQSVTHQRSTGAYLATSFKDSHTSLAAKWIPLKLTGVEPVPLVLGATYAFSVEYYRELRGLAGLKYYGSDEPWISLKSWAIGDGCAVITDVNIGHLFRSKHPYPAYGLDALYNKLFMAAVVFPKKTKWLEDLMRLGGPKVSKMFKENETQFRETRSWFAEVEKPGWRETFSQLNGEFTEQVITL